jgi:hypothetical protein
VNNYDCWRIVEIDWDLLRLLSLIVIVGDYGIVGIDWRIVEN